MSILFLTVIAVAVVGVVAIMIISGMQEIVTYINISDSMYRRRMLSSLIDSTVACVGMAPILMILIYMCMS